MREESERGEKGQYNQKCVADHSNTRGGDQLCYTTWVSHPTSSQGSHISSYSIHLNQYILAKQGKCMASVERAGDHAGGGTRARVWVRAKGVDRANCTA